MYNEFQTYKDCGLVAIQFDHNIQKFLPHQQLTDQIISVRLIKYVYANPGATKEDILIECMGKWILNKYPLSIPSGEIYN